MTDKDQHLPVKRDQPKVWRHEGKTYFEHLCNEDRVVSYSLPEVIWTVLSVNPLTLRVPVNCGFCGLEGRFTEGKWIPLRDGGAGRSV